MRFSRRSCRLLVVSGALGLVFLGSPLGAWNDAPGATSARAEDSHDEHEEAGHDEHGEEDGHDEHGEEDGHDEHEDGIVQLTPEALKEINIQLGVVTRRPFRQSIRTTGELKLHPDLMARIGPRIGGRVEELQAKEGDQVKKGQTLAYLISVQLGEAKANFLARKAKLGLAQSNFEREKNLRSKGISSEKDLLEAEAARVEAKVELDSAENLLHVLGLTENEIQELKSQEHELSGFVVRAPFSGVILERPVALGQMAEETTTLFVLADLSVLWAQLNIFERDLGSVGVGSSVQLFFDAFPTHPVQGEISYISAQIDERTRAARVRVVVENPDGRLRPGMFLTAMVEGSIHRESATLVIAESAVQRNGDKLMVFVPEDAPGRFQSFEVQIGESSNGYTELLHGLEEGMQVVTQGSFLLKSELAKESMGGGHSH